MSDPDLFAQARDLLEACRQARVTVATAESCTGGLIAATLTEIAGSSDVVDRGFVTYSNEAKAELLDVPHEMLRQHGAVSAKVAAAMAAGALAHSRADVAVSVTGVAGPGGGSDEKPVGLVFIGIATRGGEPASHRYRFDGDRQAVRAASVEAVFDLIRAEVAAR